MSDEQSSPSTDLAPQIKLMRALIDDYEAEVEAGRSFHARNTAYQMSKVVFILYNEACVADRPRPGTGMAL